MPIVLSGQLFTLVIFKRLTTSLSMSESEQEVRMYDHFCRLAIS